MKKIKNSLFLNSLEDGPDPLWGNSLQKVENHNSRLLMKYCRRKSLCTCKGHFLRVLLEALLLECFRSSFGLGYCCPFTFVTATLLFLDRRLRTINTRWLPTIFCLVLWKQAQGMPRIRKKLHSCFLVPSSPKCEVSMTEWWVVVAACFLPAQQRALNIMWLLWLAGAFAYAASLSNLYSN